MSENTQTAETLSEFRDLFGRPVKTAAEAPGRVNLMGEHTDYNGGWVLPLAIPQRTRVEFAPNDSNRVRAQSADFPQDGIQEYVLGQEAKRGGWIDYIQGMTAGIARSGIPLRGFDARISSFVPLGSGLSSSAALEIALGRGLRILHSETQAARISDQELAQIAQRAEVEFVGANVGIMDQMAASFADERHALWLNTRTLWFEKIAIPEGIDVVVIYSGIRHQHAGGDYNQRRRECQQAAKALGVQHLTDISTETPELLKLPDPLNKRARHVVTENQRVQQTVEALRKNDFKRAGELFYQSHQSQSCDFGVSVPEIDWLISKATEDVSFYGGRLTGGGFGGSIVLLARAGEGWAAGIRLLEKFELEFRLEAEMVVPPAGSSR